MAAAVKHMIEEVVTRTLGYDVTVSLSPKELEACEELLEEGEYNSQIQDLVSDVLWRIVTVTKDAEERVQRAVSRGD